MAVNFVATVCGDMFGSVRAWLAAAVVIFVWGVTFANTRALLADFSALEILVVRFALAWGALWGWERIAARPESAPYQNAGCLCRSICC